MEPNLPPARERGRDGGDGLGGFWALIVTQFQGAFSDNALKTLVIFLIMGMALPDRQRQALVPAVGALFALPFILFSMVGGYLADRYSKRSVTIAVKFFEIAVMGLAVIALGYNLLSLQLLSVFLMGVHSALFGPSKYGLLPELLPERRLSWGNGILELGTFLAIITGTIAGGLLTEYFSGRQFISGCIFIGLALAGLSASLRISRVTPAAPAKKFRVNFVADLARQIALARRDRALWLALLGNTYFFFLAALLQFNIVIYGKIILGLSDSQNGYLQAAIAIGIGMGSLGAGYLSGGKIEYGLIPLGALGLTGWCAFLANRGLHTWSFASGLLFLGVFSGFFIVPVAALLQHRPARADKGGILAAANLLSFIGVFTASGVFYLLNSVWRLDPPAIFLCAAVGTLGVTVYLLRLLPDALIRLALWFLTHSVYRIKVRGRDFIPGKGGALFVANHVSMVDALLILASTDRLVRFVIYRGIYELAWVKPIARILKVIPISNHSRPREMIASLQAASRAIQEGHIVCIFAEGQMTRTGQLLPFRRGLERIMRSLDAPIVPVCLDRVWGSIFSFERGRFLNKWPRKIPYPVTVTYGEALPAQSSATEVREAIQNMLTSAWAERKQGMLPVGEAFVQTARGAPFQFALGDAKHSLSFGKAYGRALVVALRLQPIWREAGVVGICAPRSVTTTLITLATLLAGKMIVNFHSIEDLREFPGLKLIITGKGSGVELASERPIRRVFLEDLEGEPSVPEKVRAVLVGWFCSRGVRAKMVGEPRRPRITDPLAVLFSDRIKASWRQVVLSDYNLVSSIEQFEQVFGLRQSDRLLVGLPAESAAGFVLSVVLPAVLGVGVIFPPHPLETLGVGEAIRKHRVRGVVTTRAVLEEGLATWSTEDLSSAEFILISGTLPESLTRAFEEKFKIRPLAGLEMAECAGFIAVNTRDFRLGEMHQVGGKPEMIGHPLPGVALRVVDDQGVPVGANEAGRLLVRGPNVMQDGAPGRLLDGWLVTEEQAMVDADGFLKILEPQK